MRDVRLPYGIISYPKPSLVTISSTTGRPSHPMTVTGFTDQDFDVFSVPGLEARMEVLIERVRPKLEALGAELSPYVSALAGEEMFVHVAKHARRTVNPPIDTWVAWAPANAATKHCLILRWACSEPICLSSSRLFTRVPTRPCLPATWKPS